jgi:imidazolonepropionase-like amidohydrolase
LITVRNRIEADVMIPGCGEPVPDGVVITDDAVITYAGPAGQAPETPDATVVRAGTVMPGLWDCHAHFLGVHTLDLNQVPLQPLALRAARATAYAQAKVDAIADQHAAAVTLAHESGVTVAAGTDLVRSGGPQAPASWGRNGRELPLLGALGFSPLAVIEAATANGPATLGPQAPRSGQLRAGYDADLLTLDADPLADLAVFAQPAHITGVWKSGRRVKG